MLLCTIYCSFFDTAHRRLIRLFCYHILFGVLPVGRCLSRNAVSRDTSDSPIVHIPLLDCGKENLVIVRLAISSRSEAAVVVGVVQRRKACFKTRRVTRARTVVPALHETRFSKK